MLNRDPPATAGGTDCVQSAITALLSQSPIHAGKSSHSHRALSPVSIGSIQQKPLKRSQESRSTAYRCSSQYSSGGNFTPSTFVQ